MIDLALVTCAAVPELPAEDAVLVDALARRGILGHPVIWDATPAPTPDAWLIRSAWDYHHRPAEFLAWVDRVAAGRPLWNDPALIRWNAHKKYLRELAARGVDVIPTFWADGDDGFSLDQLVAKHEWQEFVIKPAVSASAHQTARFTREASAAARAHLATVVAAGTAMIQPYFASVESYGERSFFFVDGAFTHAVRRQPVLAQRYEADAPAPLVEPTIAELTLCRATLAALEMPPLYARVDIAPDERGVPRLMEVELIEPRMYFREGPEAAERMADGLRERLTV